MAPVLGIWTLWLLLLWQRSWGGRTRCHHALAYVAVLVGLNAGSVTIEALGAEMTLAGKWIAVGGTILLGLDMIRRTWHPDSPHSRALLPPNDEEIQRRIEVEVVRRLEEKERQLWMQARSNALAEVVLMECNEDDDREMMNGHAAGK